jgi:predicted acylesterase/phospholipase RssA
VAEEHEDSSEKNKTAERPNAPEPTAPPPDPKDMLLGDHPADEKKAAVPKDPEGNDGVCFTAGPKATVIGAGAIHAYLAARRRSPKVVAGISMGALNAAAMQRVYREMQRAEGAPPAEREAARWKWFREYLDAMCDQPFDVIWNAIPDQSDFYADMVPIRDAAVPRAFDRQETVARRHLYLTVKLGRWLAQLPVTVRLFASMLVNYVRMMEKYPPLKRALSGLGFLANVGWLTVLVTLHACLAPQFLPEHIFRAAPDAVPKRRRFRIPGIGWLNLFSLTVSVVVLFPLLVVLLVYGAPQDVGGIWRVLVKPTLLLVFVSVVLAITKDYRKKMMGWWIARKGILPACGVAAYVYSFINVICVGWILGVLGWALVSWVSSEGFPSVLSSVPVVMLYLFLPSVVFASITILPEIRSWLVAHGLLEQWPRPLFGWVPFLFLWVSLASLLGTVSFGILFLCRVHPGATGFPSVYLAVIFRLGVLILLPLVPLVLPVILWKHMRRIAAARSGWRKVAAWVVSGALTLMAFSVAFVLFWIVLDWVRALFASHDFKPWSEMEVPWRFFVLSAFLQTTSWLVFFTMTTQPALRRWLFEWLLDKVDLNRSLIDDLYLRLKLHALFDPATLRDDSPEPKLVETVDEGPGYPAALFVAAALQTLYEKGKPKAAYQLWAKPGTPLVHALRCAVSVPPLFAPVRVAGRKDLSYWLKKGVLDEGLNQKQLQEGIDLVDGSVIRQNPLPAIYSYLRGLPAADEMEANNDRDHPAIHVIYGVPIEGTIGDGAEGIRNNIVDVGQASLRLSERRDTQLEVYQTNIIARMEQVTPGTSVLKEKVSHAIFADEIAPRTNLKFVNEWGPARDEVLDCVAAGCRRTLETLYRNELSGMRPAGGACVQCSDLLVTIGRAPASPDRPPGLPEVCGRCVGTLFVPPAETGAKRGASASMETLLSEPADLAREHPQLSGEAPRIVLVASGGVFRGAFHIGMLAALGVGRVRPDLIVGASVGTLMGGALGAMWTRPETETLERLVDLFLRVDERVALTRTLKSAAREIGIRGRSVAVSPRVLRRMVRRGARRDPGFAATGAPSALIDSFSTLFMIPYRQTARIVSLFIAGHVTDATKAFLRQVRTETIRRLDIEQAVIGASLLELAAADLLAARSPEDRLRRQPFQGRGIAFFGTTTNLRTQTALLLGGNGLYPDAPYDYVEAALASSAFPAVFAPRAESRVFPGTGRSDVLFADGGMFDNLPFVPAIEILSRAQRGYLELDAGMRKEVRARQRELERLDLPADPEPETDAGSRTVLQRLERRIRVPDLLIAGALDPRPETDEAADGAYDSLAAIGARASSLKHNVKIRSFELASQRIYSQILRLDAAQPEWGGATQSHFVDGVVNAGVLAVFPASRDHLNGTFSFSASTGLKAPRIERSIADGCYQTLLGLASAQVQAEDARAADLDRNPDLLTARSVSSLTKRGRIARLRRLPKALPAGSHCPYFEKDGKRFACPFAATSSKEHYRQMRGVFDRCRTDSAHWS